MKSNSNFERTLDLILIFLLVLLIAATATRVTVDSLRPQTLPRPCQAIGWCPPLVITWPVDKWKGK